MSLLRLLRLVAGGARVAEAEPFVERRAETRRPVFQEVMLTLEDFQKIRAVITNLSSRGARIEFSARIDLPFRIKLNAQILKLNCWARVVWQADGAAGLEFLPEETAPTHP